MTLRRTIFWIHLCVGVTGAVVVLMMSVTGVILTYEMQLNEWARRSYRATSSGPDAKPASGRRSARARRERIAGDRTIVDRGQRGPVGAGGDRLRPKPDVVRGPVYRRDSGERRHGDAAVLAQRHVLAPLVRARGRQPSARTCHHRRGQPRLPLPGHERVLPLVAAHVDAQVIAQRDVVPARPRLEGAGLQLAQRDRLLDGRAAAPPP
jgi:hypothetical protein